MRRVQYWLTAHWPPLEGEIHSGVLIRRRADEPTKEAKRKAKELQGAIHRGDLVFVYETRDHGNNTRLRGKGKMKVVALLKVTGDSDFVEFTDQFIPVKETRWVAEVDCPVEIARDATGLKQLGRAYLNFGSPLKGTRIQLLDDAAAVRLLSYVCDPSVREKLVAECLSPATEGEDGDDEYQELSRQAEPDDRQEGPRRPGFVDTAAGRQVRRDPRIAKIRFLTAHYRCEIDAAHQTFTSRTTNEKFVEAHHLIPARVQIQKEFGDDVALDHESNIVSLCPNCHRLLHHAILGEKEAMLRNLYRIRRKELEQAGIKVTSAKLLRYYQ